MWARLRRDNRGASVVAYALLLPVFILVVFGTLEIWRVIAVKQTLHLGVYQGARQLSVEGRAWRLGSIGQWEQDATSRAYSIIDRELKRNTLLPAGYALRVHVTIEPQVQGADIRQLGWLFSVRAEVVSRGLVTLPLLQWPSVTLTERQISYVERVTGDWTPPTEGGPY